MTELKDQVIAQCKVVAHLATALATVNTDYAEIFLAKGDASESWLNIVGDRTSYWMEELGNALNAIDAVIPDDAWVDPVFEEAQRRWPQKGDHTNALLSELRAVLTFLEDEIAQWKRPAESPEDGSFLAEARKRADSIAAVIKQATGET